MILDKKRIHQNVAMYNHQPGEAWFLIYRLVDEVIVLL